MAGFAFRGEYHDDWLNNADELGFPSVQQKLRAKPTEEVTIDFSECEWISAACSLALFTELANSSAINRRIRFNFGSTTTVDSRACVRKFLASQGFLSCIVNASFRPECYVLYDRADGSISSDWIRVLSRFEPLARSRTTSETISLERLSDYICDSSAPLLFGDLAIIRAHLFELTGPTTVMSKTQRVVIDELMREADSILYRFNARDRSYRDTTLQRVNQSLLELLANCNEHSVDAKKKANTKSYAGVFVRLTPTKQSSDRAHRTLAVAASRSFALNEVMRGNDKARVEVYVVDTGVGLLAHAPNWQMGSATTSPAGDLRAVARQLFVSAVSRHRRDMVHVAADRGLKTGFQHLHTIWSHSNDWSRVLTGREWLAGPHPRPPGWDLDSESTGGYRELKGVFLGTLVHVVITPSLPPPLAGNWFDSANKSSAATLRSVVGAIDKDVQTTGGRQHVAKRMQSSRFGGENIVDGSGSTCVLNVRRGEALKSVERSISQLARRGLSKLFVRLHRVTEKNIVTRIIESWQKAVLADSRLTHATIYICDLGRYQALDTAWVLEKSTKIRLSSAVLVPPRASIVVVTEDLCLGAFNVSWARAGSSDHLEFEGLPIQIPVPAASELEDHLFGLVSVLRDDDSEQFWNRLKAIELQRPDSFSLIRNVRWQSKPLKILPIYVNLSQVIHDRDISRSIRRALRRLLALFPYASHTAIDGVVDAPLHDAKKWLASTKAPLEGAVLVGSTSVTGRTLIGHASRVTKLTAIIDILESPYFSYAQLVNAPHLCAIRWIGKLPKRAPTIAEYERIPGTPYIRPVENISAGDTHHRAINYKYLVSNDLLRLGHWTYGDRHSLLEIDTGSLIEFSARTETELINWLVEQIRLICQKSPVVLVFPMHRWGYTLAHIVYEHVLLRTRDQATDSLIAAQQRCILIPLVMMQRVAGGLTRIAPLSNLQMARAKDLFSDSGPQPTVVILDTAYITNRTRRHIERQIRSLGFEDVRATGAINRSSMPSLTFEESRLARDRDAFEAYLRWNVPILGSNHHCAVCKNILAFKRVQSLIKRSQPDLVGEVASLLDTWSAKDAADHFATSGVQPRMLSPAAQDLFARLPKALAALMPWPYSTAVAASFVERLREGVSLAELAPSLQMLVDADPYATIEIASSCLLLAGYSESASEHSILVSILVESLVRASRLERCVDPQENESQQAVLYLSILVIVAIEPAEKRTHLRSLIGALTGGLLSNSFRLAVFVYLSDVTGDYAIARELGELVEDISADADKRLADRNFSRVAPFAKGYARSMTALLELFGETANHARQAAISRLETALASYVSLGDEKSRTNLLDEISTTLARFAEVDIDFLINCIGVQKDHLDFLLVPVSEYADETGAPIARQIRRLIDHLNNQIGGRLYGQLVKYGSIAEAEHHNLATPFVEMMSKLNQQASRGQQIEYSIDFDQSAHDQVWPTDARGYLPFVNEALEVLARVLSNAMEHGIPSTRKLFGSTVQRAAWVTVVPDGTRGVRIDIENAVRPREVSKLGAFDLANFRFLVGLGFEATGAPAKRGDEDIYITKVRIPSTATIKEQL